MLFRLLFTLLLGISLSSCGEMGRAQKGSGKIVKEERKVDDFHKIVLSGVGRLELGQGEIPKVLIETDDNLMEFIRTQVMGGTLYIETLNNVSLSPTNEMVYHVTVRDLNEVDVSGAASVKTLNPIKAESLKVILSGAGSIALDVDAIDLTVDLSGSGNVKLNGKAEHQDVSVSGAGLYKGFGLVSTSARVSVSGVGSAEVNAQNELDVSISGVGSLNYKGTPQLKQTISGVGTVRHVE